METLADIAFWILVYALIVLLLLAVIFEGGRRLQRKDLQRLMRDVEPVSSDDDTPTLRGVTTNGERNL